MVIGTFVLGLMRTTYAAVDELMTLDKEGSAVRLIDEHLLWFVALPSLLFLQDGSDGTGKPPSPPEKPPRQT